MLHVCGLSTLQETVDRSAASHVLTVISARTPVDTPRGIDPDNHLFLGFDDIVVPIEGYSPPQSHHVEQVLEFARSWDQAAPMVIHCWAGISRSTSSAYAIACALHPDQDETELALALRRASPSATPNQRIVAFADDLLGRQGRMVRAIDSIGRGADAYEGRPFSFWPPDVG